MLLEAREGAKMQIELLREFIVLAQSLNYRRAADRLFLTQPTLSKHIKELERELGVALFERNTKQVSLTEAGEHLQPIAQSIVDRYRSLVDEAAVFGVADIVIGLPLRYPLYKAYIEKVLNHIAEDCDTLRCRIVDTGISGDPIVFLDGACQIVLSWEEEEYDDRSVTFEPLLQSRFEAWVSKSSPFALREKISIKELAGMIYRPASSDIGNPGVRLAKRVFDEWGIEPTIGRSVDDLYQIGDNDFAIVYAGGPNAFFRSKCYRCFFGGMYSCDRRCVLSQT